MGCFLVLYKSYSKLIGSPISKTALIGGFYVPHSDILQGSIHSVQSLSKSSVAPHASQVPCFSNFSHSGRF